ncbi:MAG TPA: response regulator [Bacteroidia bacterium]|nr:response regulator [Bacteroidia bacterium]HRH07902.1 response regulator [Bacteroidia bacterium]
MKKVLLVEDEAIIALSTKKMLEKTGLFEVSIIDNGTAAINFLKQEPPQIILMDIKIVGMMDGIETMHEIRKFSNVPVVYLTGNSDPRARIRAKATENSEFLTKPVEISELLQCISNLLDKQ